MRLLYAVLLLLGAVSGGAGVRYSLVRSQDFQWSGVRLLLQHIDPWRDYLMGDPAHALIATQVPNYLPILYILIAPLGSLPASAADLTWGCCNLIFAIASAILAARFYRLQGAAWAAGICAAFLAATPTRISIANGQQGLFVLFLWSVSLLCTARLSLSRSAIAGISYLKYSFAPALGIFLLLSHGIKRGWRLLLCSVLPCAAATVLVWLWLTGGSDPHALFTLFTEPLAVAKSGYQPTSDPGLTLMDLGEFALGGNLVATPRLTAITFVMAITLTTGVLLSALQKLKRRNVERENRQAQGWLLALMALMSFTFYKHHAYDEVVFLFPLCYALRDWRRPAAITALVLMGYHLYIQRFLDRVIQFSFTWSAIRLASFCAILACIYQLAPKGRPIEG